MSEEKNAHLIRKMEFDGEPQSEKKMYPLQKEFIVDGCSFRVSYGNSVEKTLDVGVFLKDLKSLFDEHGVYSMMNGHVGWLDNGQFGLVETDVNLVAKKSE